MKRTPSSQNFPERKKLVAKRRKPVKKQLLMEVKEPERRKPEQNNFPSLGAKNVKGLVLPQPPRIIKKARRQRKPPTIGSEDQNQLSIQKFLEATRGVQPQNVSPLDRVPTPVKNKSDTGVLKKVDTGVLKTLKMMSKRKFAGNDEISRKVKFMKLGSENSEKCEKRGKSEKSEKK